MKKKRSRPSLAGKTSLRGTGCLSANQAKQFKAHQSSVDWREMKWGERLKFEMERAEAYFWRQTADRRQIQKNYLAAKIWKSGFNYGKA
jgi:hypothetical protein